MLSTVRIAVHAKRYSLLFASFSTEGTDDLSHLRIYPLAGHTFGVKDEFLYLLTCVLRL